VIDRRTSSDRRDAIANRRRLGKSATILPRGAASRTHSPRLGRRLKAIQKIEVNNETFLLWWLHSITSGVLSDAGLLLSSAAVGCLYRAALQSRPFRRKRSCVEPQVTPSESWGCTGERDDVPSPGGSLEAYAVESRPFPQ